jgi:phage-related protein
MTTFTIVPATAQLTKRPKILAASFGDGYTQRTPNGLNSNPASWQLTFNFRTLAASQAFLAFLDALGGTAAFTWTARGEAVAKRWTCKEYGVSEAPGAIWRGSATFEQDFGN